MNQKVLQTLEYDKIKSQLSDFLSTPIGRQEADALQPITDVHIINYWLQETADAMMIDRLKGGIPLAKLADITPHLKRLNIQASLSATELAEIGNVLRNTSAISNFFIQMKDESIGESLEVLIEQAEQLETLPEVTKSIQTAIDSTGRINDEASYELKSVRGKIVGHENAIKNKMQEFTKGKTAQYLSDPIVTIRSDRYVLPVKAEYRSQFGGVVHDQSQTGLTLYIEPQAVVELSNKLSELRVKESAEEQRVLQELSAELEPHTNEIQQNVQILGHFDFVNAKARLAARLDAMQPTVSVENHISLRQAWHPLLDKKIAVANDISLGDSYKTIIITGPNTGGKTITIKTLGLLQLMAQSGLFITTRQPSTIGIFDEVFADIGDEQSIEQNLSTFSSHMANIVSMLDHIDDKTLVIFDELGAGTDPAEGAALAIAILDKVASLGAYTIATTHYPELKLYGYNRPETKNASMVFDVETLQPTYQFLMGVPGQSNALAIAKRLGFGEDVIGAAMALTDESDQDLNNMIADLVAQRDEVKKNNEELRSQLKATEEKSEALSEEQSKLEKERAHVILDAKNEANHIVAATKKQAEQLISEIRKERLRAGQRGELTEQELQARKGKLDQLRQNDSLEKNKILQKAKKVKELAPGDEITVRSYSQQGTLVKKHKNGQWEVEMGILKMLVDEDDIVKTEATVKAQKGKAKKKQQKIIRKTTSSGSTRASVKSSLDLRGVRYEAALTELDRYLDTAVLANISPVEIIHGKGTGALRQGVTEFLRSDRRVKSYHFASANAGGDGATIVELK
ncbi:endonuclease MutS2 [Leuconostoc mesenteroides]|uniref:Endonuclease MutS2 n=1 Tax=Leuconostoc mesenteroides subsp. mesenteroides (strain ATCC 8293 / DSM 20343 / BCRC 11652 / CCM 1803 / JCM 6124 / NCDO 523 / NBRC 100496 / NCIMB 8023 / NCTC 12954 / NRRL B-1118 / 37Y) TaxID=203120 RepID=MUTS2_LEUMM|nr:endonuclease MutS2 [Leuconostoc mesenteroides]Q03VG8.1 RecName: Full=Endonuclease MutS2 [Leuconostoc mesenteroides subsp. mesenteroides ATCC 8293]ABJ62804.1 MutS family ATPase [Leuconostoc mesenteroides subsp. mesenteroides ATCC 8293]MCT3043072.1 endonuclease MutS2 [Leuconostoc mesenteroides]MCU4664225.1 endonuclease MutS2 [Leuconostoc mesenteroides]MDG9747353.1 endonuclease MutS2 [Leuconostoc mesenteroides]QHM55371.1 Endonuclease MutS2 [Leuconostoc mesenteroides]